MGVLEIFDGLSWRHFIGVLELFSRCPGDISSVSWRYLIVVLEIFDRCSIDI